MNKIITFFFAVATLVTGIVIPQQAEALKIRVEPSISFHQSHSRHYQQPQRYYHHHHQPAYYYQPPVVQSYYYYPEAPVAYVEHYYPSSYYSAPVHTHSTTVNYGTTFRFR